MNTATLFRLLCLTALWIILCYLLIQGRGINLWTIFVIVASGIVVFVPLYKKNICAMEMERPDTTIQEADNKYPLLQSIDSPADLRRLPQSALPESMFGNT